jgi:hypothetical protein
MRPIFYSPQSSRERNGARAGKKRLYCHGVSSLDLGVVDMTRSKCGRKRKIAAPITLARLGAAGSLPSGHKAPLALAEASQHAPLARQRGRMDNLTKVLPTVVMGDG